MSAGDPQQAVRRWFAWYRFYRDARKLGHSRRLAKAWATYALAIAEGRA